MIFSFNKIFWLIIILLIIWYGFKFIEKRNKNLKKSKKNNDDKENIEAFQCKVIANVANRIIPKILNNSVCKLINSF